MEFRTAYGPKRKVSIEFKDRSLTKQSMQEETNINFIVEKYQKTGMIAHKNIHHGEYSDFGAIDYHAAMTAVVEAQQMFDSLPSLTRKRFGNDPGAFLAFVENDTNIDEMRSMGLMDPLRNDEGIPKKAETGEKKKEKEVEKPKAAEPPKQLPT